MKKWLLSFILSASMFTMLFGSSASAGILDKAKKTTEEKMAVSEDESDLVARIEDLENENRLLKERILRLEQTVFEEKPTTNTAPTSESFSLSSGLYIVGEDINAGKYSVSITNGEGALRVFSDYDKYIKTEGNQFDALQSYDVAEPDKTDNPYWTYVSEVGNLILKDGMCLVLEEVTGDFTAK